MKHLRLLALFLVAVAPAAALAQEDPLGEDIPQPPPPGEAAPDPEPDEGEDEGPIEEPDIPDDGAVTVDDLEGGTSKTFIRYTKKTYPIEVTKRPLTLTKYQAEISLDAPFVTNEGNAAMWQVLRGAYGITQDLEVGITYSFGLINLSGEGDGFIAGKAFSFDGGFTFWPQHWAVRGSLAFYVDPDNFGMGINLGAPFRFTIGDRWAIFGLHDLLQIGIVKMPVDVANPGYNEAIVVSTGAGLSEEPVGNLAINAGAMYQLQPNVVLYGTMGLYYPDFEQSAQTFPMFLGGTWSKDAKLDVGGRLGFTDPDQGFDAFALSVYAAYRL